MQLIDALSASSTGDFLELESGGKSFLGVDRKLEYFDDDFFSLVPEFTNILKVTSKSGVIQEELTELVVVLFRTKALLAETTRLQRDGYHAA
ncbi:hypothetical protein [Psychrobacter frigidicola]|nr:hypothetical protein [Psychrobacter frigidicola]